MNYKITALYVYPIKSLKGIALDSVALSETGFAYDRFWMLVDRNGQFLTQRQIPELALFETAFEEEGLLVSYQSSSIFIPFAPPQNTGQLPVQIWDDQVLATKEEEAISNWFSKQLGQAVFLVRQAENEIRPVRQHEEVAINFPDGNQYLVLGESALAFLNEKLEQPIPIDRFRANIIFEGGSPHIEDTWQDFQIDDLTFKATKRCSRCPVICIDQATAERSKEPTKTLATYRVINRKVCFGAFFKWTGKGDAILKIGDNIRI